MHMLLTLRKAGLTYRRPVQGSKSWERAEKEAGVLEASEAVKKSDFVIISGTG
jgi:ketol-acid reductoisomerase